MEIQAYERMRPFIVWMELMLCEKMFGGKKRVLPPVLMRIVLACFKKQLDMGIIMYGGRHHLVGTHSNYTLVTLRPLRVQLVRGVAYKRQAIDGINYHKAIRMSNGSILVSGGHVDSLTYEKKCMQLTSSLNPDGAFGDMAVGREHHSLVLLTDGRIMVAGGRVNCTESTDTIEFAHPIRREWQLSPKRLPYKLSEHQAVVLIGGNVLLMGGNSGDEQEITNKCLIFIVDADIFLSVTPMNMEREAFAACLMPDGHVLVCGGSLETSSSSVYCEIFNTTTGAWSPAASMNHSRSFHTLLPFPDGPVVVGSHESTKIPCEQFSLVTRTWNILYNTENDTTEPACALIY